MLLLEAKGRCPSLQGRGLVADSGGVRQEASGRPRGSVTLIVFVVVDTKHQAGAQAAAACCLDALCWPGASLLLAWWLGLCGATARLQLLYTYIQAI